MSTGLLFPITAAISDWSGLVAAGAALVGLVLVVAQLRKATAASRAQATIQFQRAFQQSAPARGQIQASFPIHESSLAHLSADQRSLIATWKESNDLDDEQQADAKAVINAMNDVAQYVADGLPMRSALQQYHLVFVRLGFLVLPYVELLNARTEGRRQGRVGRRLVHLYNGAIDYHLRHPKHRGRELVLKHDAKEGGQIRIVLLDEHGNGIAKHQRFADEAFPQPETLHRRLVLRRAIRKAERSLRS